MNTLTKRTEAMDSYDKHLASVMLSEIVALYSMGLPVAVYHVYKSIFAEELAAFIKHGLKEANITDLYVELTPKKYTYTDEDYSTITVMDADPSRVSHFQTYH